MVKVSLSGHNTAVINCDEGIEWYLTRIELFYFDDNFRRMAQWVLALKGMLPSVTKPLANLESLLWM